MENQLAKLQETVEDNAISRSCGRISLEHMDVNVLMVQ